QGQVVLYSVLACGYIGRGWEKRRQHDGQTQGRCAVQHASEQAAPKAVAECGERSKPLGKQRNSPSNRAVVRSVPRAQLNNSGVSRPCYREAKANVVIGRSGF